MKTEKILNKKSPKSNFIRIVLVVCLIAILFTIKEIASFVVNQVANVSGNKINIPVSDFTYLSSQIAWLSIGIILLLISPLFIVPLVKYGLIIIGALLVGTIIFRWINKRGPSSDSFTFFD